MKHPTVLIVRNAAPSDFGGAETYPVSLASILQSKTTVSPILVSRSQKLLDYAAAQNIQTIKGWWWHMQNWSGKRALLLPVYVLWQVSLILWYAQLIIRTKAAAVHLQSKDDFIAGTLAARLLGRRAVWTDHMDLRYIVQNTARQFKNPVGKLVVWAARYATKIIIISDNEYCLVTSQLGQKQLDKLKNRFIIIKNGVVDQKERIKTPTKPTDEFHFCVASRLVVNKGVGDAIAAFSELTHDKDSRLFLDIYGDGADAGEFKKQAHHASHVVFHGHTSDPLAAIAASDVFLLPSYQEGFSIALLEATMLGKAIIATNVDSNPEIIHDRTTGLLVSPRSPAELARAMQQLAEDKKLKNQLEKNARKNYLNNYRLDTIVLEQIAPLYGIRDIIKT